jgi:hypothetical protein
MCRRAVLGGGLIRLGMTSLAQIMSHLQELFISVGIIHPEDGDIMYVTTLEQFQNTIRLILKS